MAILSPAELLDWLERNQFLNAQQMGALRVLQVSFLDSHTLAKELIRRDWLTPFQVNQILQGKHEQLVIDSYRLTERIGEGAMGQVFKAWQPKFDRVVAVKLILKELANSAKAQERFRREAEAASKLDHPNIAKVLDASECEGRPYLVMEFIDGFNLSLRVKQQGALPIHEAAEYARQTALGLQHALERGIVHRDIKPANLLVVKGSDGVAAQIKILDFGLARLEGEEDDTERLTEIGKLLGTIDYVAPEQASDAHGADVRADIYSLGCTMFYLLTAQPPFGGENIVEKLSPRMTGEAPWIRSVRPEVPPGLEEVLRKMMARKPADRYQTPAEVAQALLGFTAPLAMAAPAAPVALAKPVAPGAVVGNVALAMPIAPGPSVTEEERSFDGMTATGLDLSSGASAARPPAPKSAKAFPLKLVLIVGSVAAGIAFLACIGCILSSFVGPTPKKVTGSIVITKAYYANPKGESKPGLNRIFVFIQRVDFAGDLKVTLKDLPPDVNVDEVIMHAAKDRIEVPFTVSFGATPQTKKIRVHVRNEPLGISAEQEMTLIVIDDPSRIKK